MQTLVNPGQAAKGHIGRIPIRNLWLLMLYASDLTRFQGPFSALIDADLDELPDLVARLLAKTVEARIRRNLTRNYHLQHRVLKRVRGRIDVLTTECRQLLSKGEISCGFDELTIDTPRNRLVRSALELMARLVENRDLARQCRSLANGLAQQGVRGCRPSRTELATDQIGRNDAADRMMVALARLSFDLALPTEEVGPTPFFAPDREETWVRRLFEKAILGFARFELEPQGWSIRGGVTLDWQVGSASDSVTDILPRMVTDIVLDPPSEGRRLVIDTKFTSILTNSRFGEASLKSGYIYQIYAYLRSQEGTSAHWDQASGMLLHPTVGEALYESVVIQNHLIAFATVDLRGTPSAIRNELRNVLQTWI